MKTIFKNSKKEIFYVIMILAIIISFGISIQGCSTDVEDSIIDESDTDVEYLASINSIQSQDLQIVLNSVFESIEKIKGDCNVYITTNKDIVTSIKAKQGDISTEKSKGFPRLRDANPETVKAGWTYLGEVGTGMKGAKDALDMYNKYKDDWNYSCVELRIENDGKKNNVYVKKCE
ncbi:MAG TPA: hypothetical protein DDZ96_02095 [Porphyromonadaceae bacterium]|jgi:hypothetical protein|nr:hypothetical protein [Porphyromonadaceae bacterium]